MSYRIYLVDDDRFLLDLYAIKFKARRARCRRASGRGRTPEDALQEGMPAPDAILLDIIMPGMDGFQVLEAIRKEKLVPPSTKVIILSNQGQDADIEKAKALGAAGYIVKASAIPSEVLSQTINLIEG